MRVRLRGTGKNDNPLPMNVNSKPGLRYRQQEARRQTIIAAAKALFSANGFEATTVQSIADQAMVSAPTVYTYFGSKSAILIGIITQSDVHLIAKTHALVARSVGNPLHDMKALLSLITSESLKTMDILTWRHVFANSILDPDNVIGKGYRDQNIRLYDACEDLLAKCVIAGNLPEGRNLKVLRGLCECVNHTLF